MFLPELDDLRYVKSADGRRYTGFTYTEPGGNKKTGKSATRPVRFPKDLLVTTLADAKRQGRAWIDGNKAAVVEAEVLTVNEVIANYVAVKPAKRGKGNTQHYSFEPWRLAIGDKPVTAVDDQLIYKYVAKWTAEGLASTTVLARVQHLLWAVRRAGRKKQLPADYEAPDELDLPEANIRENYLTPEDEEKLWQHNLTVLASNDATDEQRDQALFCCLAQETAGRAQAILDLRWDNGQINFRAGIIDLKKPDGKKQTSKFRAAPMISDRLRPVLRAAWQRADGTGKLFKTKMAYATFRTHVKRAELVNPECTRHDLRRTWATLKAMAGVDLYLIAKVLGDSLEMVEKHYAKFYHNQRVLDQMNMRPAVGNVLPFKKVEGGDNGEDA